MKGLLLTNDFPPMTGGEARLYAGLCATVPPDEVVVLAPKHIGDAAFDHLQPYRIERRRVPIGTHPAARLAQIALFLLHAIVLVRRHTPGRIHVGHLYLGPVAVALRSRYHIPYVLYLHGGEMAAYLRNAVVRWVVRRIIAGADLLVINSSFTREQFARMGMHLSRTVPLTLAPRPEQFTGEDRDGARKRYGVDGRKVLLTVGRLVERKGHDTVIRAMPEIARQAGPVEYLIAGEGPQEARLRSLARDLGIGDRVRFLGRVADEDLPSLYTACDLFVMPSREIAGRDGVEGFGIAFLEAAAAGLPSVGGRSGGIPDAVADGTTGLLVAPTDADEVAAAIIRLLNDPELARVMGQQARARVKSLQAQWHAAIATIWAT